MNLILGKVIIKNLISMCYGCSFKNIVMIGIEATKNIIEFKFGQNSLIVKKINVT